MPLRFGHTDTPPYSPFNRGLIVTTYLHNTLPADAKIETAVLRIDDSDDMIGQTMLFRAWDLELYSWAPSIDQHAAMPSTVGTYIVGGPLHGQYRGPSCDSYTLIDDQQVNDEFEDHFELDIASWVQNQLRDDGFAHRWMAIDGVPDYIYGEETGFVDFWSKPDPENIYYNYSVEIHYKSEYDEDLDMDGTVEIGSGGDDYAIFDANWTGPQPTNPPFYDKLPWEGDMDGDGDIDSADLGILMTGGNDPNVP